MAWWIIGGIGFIVFVITLIAGVKSDNFDFRPGVNIALLAGILATMLAFTVSCFCCDQKYIIHFDISKYMVDDVAETYMLEPVMDNNNNYALIYNNHDTAKIKIAYKDNGILNIKDIPIERTKIIIDNSAPAHLIIQHIIPSGKFAKDFCLYNQSYYLLYLPTGIGSAP